MTYDLEHKELFLLPKLATKRFKCHRLSGVFLPGCQYTDIIGTHQENAVSGKLRSFISTSSNLQIEWSGTETLHFVPLF